MFQFIFMSILAFTQADVEAMITKVNPDVSAKTKTMVAETIAEYAPKSGFTEDDDARLIIAIIQTESSFIHKTYAGADNEWGMMQVIPGDKHIRQASRRYVCHREEIDKWVRDERGAFQLCKGKYPNVDYRGNTDPYKLARVIRHSPRAGIAIGIMELAFWRDKFDSKLRERFWTKNPMPQWGSWYKTITEGLGSRLYVIHYNYGARIKKSSIGYAYPLSILKYFNKR